MMQGGGVGTHIGGGYVDVLRSWLPFLGSSGVPLDSYFPVWAHSYDIIINFSKKLGFFEPILPGF